MTVLSADHLLEQADRLVASAAGGRPRQVDLRRGISSAYYAAFHTVVTGAADEFVGLTLQRTPQHALVMRSIDHVTIRRTCEELGKAAVAPRYAPYCPMGGFGPQIRAFMEAFPILQQQRHAADYDSQRFYVTATALASISFARAAIADFRAAPPADRKAFLFLILFPPKR